MTKKFKRSQSSSPGHLPLHSVLRNHPLITARRLAVLLSLFLLSLGLLKVQPPFPNASAAMPPPADLQLGRFANFYPFPLAHKFQNDGANASRFSAQIAKRWEPGLASNGVKVTIGFTCPGPTFGNGWQLRGY